MAFFTLIRVAHKAKAEIIVEQPVGRGRNSLFAIKGKEWHTTMFDTSMGVKAIESMQLNEVPFDQGAAPISAATQKTTSFWCTPEVYKIVMKDFGSLKLKTEGVVSLKTIRKQKGTPFRTAGSEEYNSVMCEMLAHVARQLQMGTSVNVVPTAGDPPPDESQATAAAEGRISQGGAPTSQRGGTEDYVPLCTTPSTQGGAPGTQRGGTEDSVPLCTTPGTQGGAPGTQGGGTEDSVPLCTTPGTQGGTPGTQGGGTEGSVPLCTTSGDQSGATMATGKSTQYPADQESTENPSVIRSTNNKFIRRMGD